VADEWRELVTSVEVDAHSQTEEWANAGSVADGPGGAWFCAEDPDGPLAVLHCTVTRRKMGPISVRLLQNGPSDGLLAERCDPAALRTELVQAFAHAGEPVDVLSLSGLREGSAFHALASVTPSKLSPELRFGGYSVVDTAPDADEWFARAGKNLRGSLRKASNRAARTGDVRTADAHTVDEVSTAFEDYRTLEASGWKGSAGALVNRPSIDRYLETGLMGAAKAGRARVRSLWIAGELAAAQLGVLAGRTLVLLKIAYNEDLAPMAPGNLLMASLVRECCDDPDVDRIDLVTNQAWHARWHPVLQPTFQLQDFNTRRPTGLLARTGSALRSVGARTAEQAH
jgi:CelD/BcsL family acetyltransferase involved in cellulose biosynthesis